MRVIEHSFMARCSQPDCGQEAIGIVEVRLPADDTLVLPVSLSVCIRHGLGKTVKDFRTTKEEEG